MKQNIKRFMLWLCMAACLVSLTACSGSRAAEESSMDPQLEMYVCQVSEGLVEQITSMDQETAASQAEILNYQGESGLAGALTSWAGVMKDTGDFVQIISSEAQMTDDGCAGIVNVQFEKRNAAVKLFYELDRVQMVPNTVASVSITPEYTVGENMSKAGMNTLMGMGTVFVVLIFLSFLIASFKYINLFEKKMKEKKQAPAPAAAPAPAVETVEEEELVDDLELVAVITAAIAAATNSSTDGLVVRSIKRAPSAKWKRA